MVDSVSGSELASLFGITERQVRSLRRKGMPVNPDGSYPLGPVIQWYVASKTTPTNLLAARTRRETALASKAELELAKMCGELMTVADYERVVSDTFMRVAAKLTALPNRAAPRMVGLKSIQEALAALQLEVAEVRRELYEADDLPAAA